MSANKHSSLFCPTTNYDEKSFFNLETKVGTSDNMFRRFSFEMKPELLKSGRGKDLIKL
jgi:hypothetical protein